MRRLLAVAGLAVLWTATALAAPAGAQNGTSWRWNSFGGVENKNDSPQLHGPNGGWMQRNPSGRHGRDHHGTYHVAYGSDDDDRANWASWRFAGLSTTRSRSYDVWVWVPQHDATAQVRYQVRLEGCANSLGAFPVLDQDAHHGWVKIGRVSLGHISRPPSRNIVIEVSDNEIADPGDYFSDRLIGVDAMLLVRGSGIGWSAVNSDQLITDANCFGDPSVPSEPRHLSAARSEDVFAVTWTPPQHDGGSGIDRYEVSYSRRAVNTHRAWSRTYTTTGTSHRLRPLFKDVRYTVRVVAINEHGERSIHAESTAVIDAPPPLPTADLDASYRRVHDCWTRDHEWDGYQQGQCTSYVAWRLRHNGVGEGDRAYGGYVGFYNQWKAAPCDAVDREGVKRWGNAAQWDDCARLLHIRVDKTPAAGSVLVRNDTGRNSLCGGYCGHVAYVEQVNADGSIVVSDSNHDSKCGLRTSVRIDKGTGIYRGDYAFIHFEDHHTKRLAS